MGAAPGATSEEVYGWVYLAGVTVGAGQGARIEGQVGVGADGSDPEAGGWTWTDAAYLGDKDGLSEGDLANDEYVATFTAPPTAGAYDYAFRFRSDAQSGWWYCDAGGDDSDGCGGAGLDDGYQPENAGQLTVE
jgi:hypothetical protein